MRYLLERPEAHYTDNYAVSEEKARLNKTVFRLRLKEVVDRCDLRSVDRVSHSNYRPRMHRLATVHARENQPTTNDVTTQSISISASFTKVK